jgi:SAM-dependent methyltransferase
MPQWAYGNQALNRPGIRMTIRISHDGWSTYNIWEHSHATRDLYLRRARDEAEEMTCASQAAELLSEIARPGDALLDVGCGSGYFYHSLRRRGLALDYHGIDATAAFIEIGRRELKAFGLSPDRLDVLRIEDFVGMADHILCMNVLSNLDSFHRPLERLLHASGTSLILRESIKDGADRRYVRDEFLDPGLALNVYVNAYDRSEIVDFIAARGFAVREVTDRRTNGKPEMVIGHPHHWIFLVATRR